MDSPFFIVASIFRQDPKIINEQRFLYKWRGMWQGGTVYVTNAEIITNDPFAVFFPWKNIFSTFSFFIINFP